MNTRESNAIVFYLESKARGAFTEALSRGYTVMDKYWNETEDLRNVLPPRAKGHIEGFQSALELIFNNQIPTEAPIGTSQQREKEEVMQRFREILQEEGVDFSFSNDISF